MHSLANAGIAYVLLVWALFPWENQDDPTSNDWLVAVAAILFASVVPTLVAVVVRRARLAKIAFAVHLAIALAILVGALESSSHSDGRLVALAFGVEATGLAALAVRFRSRSKPERARL